MKKPLPYRLIDKNRLFYLLLVNRSPILMIDLMMAGERTIKEAAQRMDLKFSTYYRLRVFYRDHQEMIREAQRSGNWRPVEEILFPELLAAYPGYADSDAAYKAAMADWRAHTKTPLWRPSVPTGTQGQRAKAKAPQDTKRKPRTVRTPPKPKSPSWLKRLLAKLGRWLDASDPQ